MEIGAIYSTLVRRTEVFLSEKLNRGIYMEEKLYKSTIQFRRGSAAEWTSINPVLRDGEPGWDKTNKKFKVGDGITSWNNLPYQESTVNFDIDVIYCGTSDF